MIRRGVTEDLAAVARIHVDAWKQVYREIMPEEVLEKRNYDEQRQAWERKLEKGEEDLYVYEINGNIAGFASCRVIDEEHAEIDTLYFDEKYRGKGYGTQMLEYLFQILGPKRKVSLWCVKENPNRKFYEANGGRPGREKEVLIGGKNVKELDYDTILKNVAIVFQKTFLTRDSVLENIRMGSSASLEEVRAAAKEAQIDDFIMSLPDGYDTKVGSFGSRFSGGEKQRIAIARAILKNAPILILDEATSASDPENQMEIDKAIQNLCKGKTVIVVAHRLSALKLCDRVAVVENHTITSVGTHEEVRRKNAYYRKAWEDYEKARNITYRLEGGAGNA